LVERLPSKKKVASSSLWPQFHGFNNNNLLSLADALWVFGSTGDDVPAEMVGLKKLITTSYVKSRIVGGQLPLLEIEELKPEGKDPFKIEINKVPDTNSNGAVDLTDVEWLLKHNANASSPLKNNGDFRSQECIDLLKEADIVVTNPPFSLFREYVAQLIEHNKKFLILGSQNAITYREIFRFIKDNKLWLGYDNGGTKWFQVPFKYFPNSK